MIQDNGYIFSVLCIGDFSLSPMPNKPNKIWINRKDGEGGEFDAAELEKAIEKFYKENF